MKAARHTSLCGSSSAHGTRARYVSGCRCEPCRASNRDAYRDRMERMREAEGAVTPSGPPGVGTMRRGGREVRIELCPGALGMVCVRRPTTWLRGQSVCRACVERATVWNGDVDPERARRHLLVLRGKGVGYKAVADASDVPASVLARVLAADGTKIRRATELAILAVDASAIADHACVDGKRTRAIIARLVARGFTKAHLAELLGSNSPALQRGRGQQVLAITEARALRLERRVLAGEVTPQRATVDAEAERAWVALMIERGVSPRHLSERLGFVVHRGQGGRMWPDNRDAVRTLKRELEDGDGLPEHWMLASDVATHALSGMGWSGDFSVRGRAGKVG